MVDDSVVVRRVLAREFSGDPQVELVGTAPNGRVALAKISQSIPDLVTLDVEMPEMDGLKTLAALREKYPDLPVIIFSALGEGRSYATLEAGLAFPGVDYVLKTAESASVSEALKVIREDLLPKIRMYSSLDAQVPDPKSSAQAPARTSSSLSPWSSGGLRTPSNGFQKVHRVDIVVVGASTGGPDALAQLLPCFPVETRRNILARVARILKPDGFLFLGGSETGTQLEEIFEPIARDVNACFRLRRIES